MSLLLDALQRASREKEKLAEERAAADKAAQQGESPAQAGLPPLSIDFAADEATAMVHAESTPTPMLVEPMAAPGQPASVPAAATSHGAESPTTPVAELSLDPIEPLTTTTTVAATATQAVSAEPLAPAPGVAPTPRVEPTQGVIRGRVEPSAPAQTRPAASSQVAREILGATAKPARSRPSRRLIVLGVVALLVAVANAAFFMGFLDNLLGVSGSSLTPPLAPPPTVVPSQPAPPQQPVAAAIAEGGGASAAAAEAKTPAAEPAAARGAAPRDRESNPDAPRHRASARTPAARAVARASGADPAKPVFIARPTAVGVLDIAYAALNEGRFDEAAAAYQRALAQNPAERDALLGLAYIAQHQGRREDARGYYQRVLRQEPGHPAASAGLLSIAAEGDLQMTASRAREMAERNPDSAVVMSTLGGILAREGRITEAQQAYFRALTLEPDNALYAYNLAVALDRLHKYVPARGYYQRALSLAEKSGAGDRANFPRAAAQLRVEQLRDPDASAQTTPLPESGSR